MSIHRSFAAYLAKTGGVMKRNIPLILAFIIAIVFGHALTLKVVPGLIMKKAMQSMQDKGLPLHKFVLGGRVTPQTQTVVRPAPDLVYSICLFDFSLTNRPLEVRAGYWADYGSVSFFDSRTNNFATVRVGADGQKADTKIYLITKDIDKPTGVGEGKTQIITSPSERGLILIRRLAPSAEKYHQVQAVSKADLCQTLIP